MEHYLKKVNKPFIKKLINVFFKNAKINTSLNKPHKSHNLNYKTRKSKNITIRNYCEKKEINNYEYRDAKLIKGLITNVEILGQMRKINSNDTITLTNNKVIELVITIKPPDT